MKIMAFEKWKILGEGNEDDSKADLMKTEILMDTETKKMVNFAVIQLHNINGKMHQIKKHDFSHGTYNIHAYYEKLNDRKEYPEEILGHELFLRCKKDITDNWMEYRKRYARKYPET